MCDAIIDIIISAGFHHPDALHQLRHALDFMDGASRRRSCLRRNQIRDDKIFQRRLEHDGEDAEEHEIQRNGEDAIQSVRCIPPDMGQPGERKGCEGKKDGQVKLQICHRNLVADDAEEHEENYAKD